MGHGFHSYFRLLEGNVLFQWGNQQSREGGDPEIHRGFLSHRGTPSHHPFYFRIFHEIDHPAIKGYPHDLRNLWGYDSVPRIRNPKLSANSAMQKAPYLIGTPFLVDLAFKQFIKKPLCWWKPHFYIGQDMWNPIFWLMTFQFLSLKSEIAMEFHWKQRFIPTFPRSDAAFPGICWPQGHAWWEFLGKADGKFSRTYRMRICKNGDSIGFNGIE